MVLRLHPITHKYSDSYTKPLQKEVDHHLDPDESRQQLRWPF